MDWGDGVESAIDRWRAEQTALRLAAALGLDRSGDGAWSRGAPGAPDGMALVLFDGTGELRLIGRGWVLALGWVCPPDRPSR